MQGKLCGALLPWVRIQESHMVLKEETETCHVDNTTSQLGDNSLNRSNVDASAQSTLEYF
jgi:hypothetical protein